MLKRLVILNSDIYAKADVNLEDCENLQIVGPNNVGKSTLIYALNFLYIIDGRQMTFSGGRTGDKATINHYFPTIHSSYIIFEIFKKRYYTILVKKNAEGSLDYYKIDTDYKEDHYFTITDQGQRLKKFDEILTLLTVSGIQFRKFQDRRELFNFIYQKGKRSNSVVWLNEGVSVDQREISNNFSKIYRYLINSKLIDNKTLKDALIIADNKENEKVEFTKRKQKDIEKLLQHNQEIISIKSIEKDFYRFRECVDQHQSYQILLSEIVFSFNHLFQSESDQLISKTTEKKTKKEELRTLLSDELNPRQNTLNQHLGGLAKDLIQSQSHRTNLKQNISRIKAYSGLDFLRESRANLDLKRKQTESSLTHIENQGINNQDLEKEIQTLKQEISRFEQMIQSYSNLLIHQITSNPKDRELLNSILSDEIAALPKSYISKHIKNVDFQMALFDGLIQLPTDFPGKRIKSIEEIKSQKEKKLKDKKHLESLLPFVLDKEKYQEELSKLEIKLKEIEQMIDEIESLPRLLEDLSKKEEEIHQIHTEQNETQKDLKKTEEKIQNTGHKIEELTRKINLSERRLDQIRDWKNTIESAGLNPRESDTHESLDELIKKFEINIKAREEVKIRKNRLFDQLRNQMKSLISSETEFIRYIESELASLENKKRSIDGLLQNIANQFSNPCKTLHSKYQEFETFINNKFNAKIRKIEISDIHSLRIEVIPNERIFKNLNKIMSIRDLTSELLFEDQSENLKILNNYLDEQRTIRFDELFDIRLHLEKENQHKIVDLKNQVESDGTDKVIRLVIIMSIIHQIVVNDEENKIVIFIDEIGTIDESNRLEIIKFCKENNFIPISAAPLHPYDGFDKYYLIRRGKGKIVIGDKDSIVIQRKEYTA